MTERKRLPTTRESLTHKFHVGPYEGYVHAGMYDDGTLGEVFLSGLGKEGSLLQGVMATWAVTLSVALQHGVPVDDLLRKYANVRFEAGQTRNAEIPHAASIVDYIGRWLALRFGSAELRDELGLPRDAPWPTHQRALKLAGPL